MHTDTESEQQYMTGSKGSEFRPRVLAIQEAYKLLGGYKCFQLFAAFTLISGFACGSFVVYSISFLEKAPRYLCYNDATLAYDTECAATEFCGTDKKYIVDWDYYTSLHNWVEQLDMTCTSKTKIGFIGSLYFLGWTISALAIPRLSDFYGRKKVYGISMIFFFFLNFGLLFSTSLDLTMALMFFSGFMSCGRAAVGFLYLMELTPVKNQPTVGTLCHIMSGITTVYSIMYLLYVSKYWQGIMYAQIFFNAVTLVGICFMPESPKWLINKNRFDEAREALKIIAKFNKYPHPIDFKFDREVQSPGAKLQSALVNSSQIDSTFISLEKSEDELLKTPIMKVQEEKQLDGSLKDLFKIRRHYINLLIMVFVWIGSSFNYYLINFQLKYIGGNTYTNTLVSTLSEIPANIIGGIAYKKLGIRAILMSAFSIGISGAICLIFVTDVTYTPIFILLSKFGVASTFNIAYLGTAQLFPAIYGGTAFGFCNMFGKMGTVLAPMVAEVSAPLPMITFCITAGFAAFLSYFIKTQDIPGSARSSHK